MTLPELSPSFDALQAQLKKIEEQACTTVRLTTTKARIAHTPKQVIWTLNKAKLYRYIPLVPEDKRHKIPLLLVFAIMNRPAVLDLRPGHSFVEYTVH
jgi:polyhydroxyalkanoate synthase